MVIEKGGSNINRNRLLWSFKEVQNKNSLDFLTELLLFVWFLIEMKYVKNSNLKLLVSIQLLSLRKAFLFSYRAGKKM